MERKKPEDLEEKGGASSGKGGKLGGLTVYIIGGIISLVLIILCSNFIGVTTKIYNKNNTSIDGEINSINALIKTMQTSIDGVPASVNSAVTTAVSSLNSQISTFTSSVNTLQGDETANTSSITTDEATLATLKTSITSMQSDIAALKTAVGNNNNTSALQASLDTLNSTVASMRTELNTDEATIKTQGTMIANLQAATTPVVTTTTTTTGVTSNNVTVSNILGNPYYSGKPIIAIPPIPVSTACPAQTFSFQVTNNGSTTITAEQVALGFTLYNTAGTGLITLPSDATVAVTSQNSGVVWSSVSTGQANVLGFENNIPTGIFAGLGEITLNAGQTQTVTLNVTVTASATNAIPACLMYIQIIPLPSK